jgi:hypothetical protein
MILMFLVPKTSFTQNLFTTFDASVYPFSSVEQTNWNDLVGNSDIEQLFLTKINNLSTLIGPSGDLSVDFPADGLGVLTFSPKLVEYKSENDYAWYGEIQGGSIDGHLKLICKGGLKAGEAQIDEFIYEFKPISNELNGLVKYSDEYLEEGDCALTGVSNLSNVLPPTGQPLELSGPCSTVRIGFVYTSKCKVNVIELYAADCTLLLNIALLNSGIPSTSLNFYNAGAIRINELVETDEINDDLLAFKSNVAVQNFRQDVGADIIVFLTDGNYKNGGDKVLGATPKSNVTSGPSASNAFCIVEADEGLSHKTICHEIGHVMGGDHSCAAFNLLPCTGTPVFSQHGFVFNISPGLFTKERHTMMVTGGFKKKRILHYSNPSVDYVGVPTGNATANMAAQLTGQACNVSSFNTNHLVSNLDVRISVPSTLTVGQQVTFSSSVSGGTLPYTYLWEISLNGINNYQPFGGNSAALTFTVPLIWSTLQNKKVYVRLRVVDANIVIGDAYGISNISPFFQDGGNNSNFLSQNDNSVMIYPNPAEKFVYINAKSSNPGTEIVAQIYDSFGQLILSKNYIQTNTDEEIRFETDLPSGIYFLHTNNENTSQVHLLKIVKQ